MLRNAASIDSVTSRGWYTAHAAIRLAVAVTVLTASLTLVPAPAWASRLSTDRVGGVRLSSGTFSATRAPDVSTRSGALIGNGGRVLWTRKANTERRMASTTKLMTALVVLERARLGDTVRVTRAAARTPYAMGLRAGERRSVRKLLELTLVGSSNDAATALAIHVGGSVSGFTRLMNARAKRLGMTDTRFRNAHGLDARGHYSSAADMAILMRNAIKNREIKRILALRSTILPRHGKRAARKIRSTDKLLGQVSGLRGGKTGFTVDAKYCFVGSARRDSVTLTTAVLGASSSSARFSESRRLLEWGFKHYRVKQVASSTQRIGNVPLSTNPSETVGVRYARTATAGVLDVLGAPTRLTSLSTSATVPVFAGQRLGIVRFLQGPEVIATVNAIAAEPRASAEETVGVVPVVGYADRAVTAKTAESTATVNPYDTSRPVERTVNLVPSVSSPVSVGRILGQVIYRQDGRLLVTVPVVASESVPATGTM